MIKSIIFGNVVKSGIIIFKNVNIRKGVGFGRQFVRELKIIILEISLSRK